MNADNFGMFYFAKQSLNSAERDKNGKFYIKILKV